MAGLTIKSNGSAIRTLPLKAGVNKLGRSPANDHSIDDPTISGQHCEIVVSDDRVLIRDLDSTNGTFIGGQRIRESVLLDGQILHLGRVEMSLDVSVGEIAIPSFSSSQETVLRAPDGTAVCANHRDSPAAAECAQCQKTFCEVCLHQIRRVGGAALTLCPSCGGHCRPIVRDVPVTKRKSRLGSWIGNVTAKMTGRVTKPDD